MSSSTSEAADDLHQWIKPSTSSGAKLHGRRQQVKVRWCEADDFRLEDQ